ncbi:ABC transporter ATP-binding protein [Actinotalea sp. K2]|uniref:ABC transporter ATP-binding protein n=1 Tax=Actinotalea sp. K2 TaxID=2939438 RepID=UPI0020171803|nr:ABC transporter ATP-binding protein [Actinotalea sp. K2]MCL3862560.1 ATP-binding cassette domain-containing protein [Actinotalea sp. K2]
MSVAAITTRGLSVHFAGRAAPSLSGVDLTVGPGERVLVLGPSGGGKSTLLHVLTGVVPQSVDADVAGEVRVLGQDPQVVPVPQLALQVGWLGQDPAAGACLPVVETEVALPLENRGVPREEIGPRVRRALVAVGAEHLARRRTSTLSGGEQQRVALAAVLAGEPEVLVLDEPTSMLDPVSAAQVLTLIGEQSRTRTTLLVEHRTAEMSWSPERAVLLDESGRVAADGPAGDLLAARRDAAGAARDPAAVPGRSGGDVVLELRRAHFAQGGHDVVRGVDLSVRRGQVTVVVGCNGSGKSSVLLGAAGLLPGGGVRAGAGAAGLVFQRPEHQFLARTVAQEVAHGLPRPTGSRRWWARASAREGVDRQEAARASTTAAWLDRFDLAPLADADPFRLSGGQQRRLSVAAMAVVGRPVLLLDEPTFGLDLPQTRAVVDLVRELADAGTAVVVATHDLDLGRRLADQVLVLSQGEQVAVGGPGLLDDAGLLAEAGLLVEAPVLHRVGRG